VSINKSKSAEAIDNMIVETTDAGPSYRWPEIHDLGKLGQIQHGIIGVPNDGMILAWYFFRRSPV
jgi:hypothetical protein